MGWCNMQHNVQAGRARHKRGIGAVEASWRQRVGGHIVGGSGQASWGLHGRHGIRFVWGQGEGGAGLAAEESPTFVASSGGPGDATKEGEATRAGPSLSPNDRHDVGPAARGGGLSTPDWPIGISWDGPEGLGEEGATLVGRFESHASRDTWDPGVCTGSDGLASTTGEGTSGASRGPASISRGEAPN